MVIYERHLEHDVAAVAACRKPGSDGNHPIQYLLLGRCTKPLSCLITRALCIGFDATGVQENACHTIAHQVLFQTGEPASELHLSVRPSAPPALAVLCVSINESLGRMTISVPEDEKLLATVDMINLMYLTCVLKPVGLSEDCVTIWLC